MRTRIHSELFHVEHCHESIAIQDAGAGAGQELIEGEVEMADSIHESDFLDAELGHDLSASTAGGDGRCGIGHNNNADELIGALSDGLMDGDAFGAERESVGKVFDIAAAKNPTVEVFDCGSYREMRIGCMGVLSCGPCQFSQCFPAHEGRLYEMMQNGNADGVVSDFLRARQIASFYSSYR